jgi:stage II sporulation protein AA (anti-sigma F factor antagonist)
VSEHHRPAPWRCEVALYPGDVMWLTLSGKVDLAVASRLRAALARARSRALLIVVDLAGLDSIDPAGLRVLMDAEAHARRGGAQLVIARPADHVRRLVALTHLTKRLTDDPSSARPRR